MARRTESLSQQSNYLCRITRNQRSFWDVGSDDACGSDDTFTTNGNAFQNDRARSDENIRSYVNWSDPWRRITVQWESVKIGVGYDAFCTDKCSLIDPNGLSTGDYAAANSYPITNCDVSITIQSYQRGWPRWPKRVRPP